jgi:DNA-binding response OmpR family regulator
MRVLIVEDEILVALDLEDALTSLGYEVVGIAPDTSEALRLAAQADVALVDVHLRDGQTGIAVGMELSRDYGVRVLFLTANPSLLGNGVPGAVGSLGKPCEPEAIHAAIEFASRGRPTAPRELRLFH